MILVDTSVWVDHLRRGNDALRQLLLAGAVLTHPNVIGELACGHLKQRHRILGLLQALPRAAVVDDDEALTFIDSHRLMGTGIGWIDVHILAGALLSGAQLWTIDHRLRHAAARLAIAAPTA